MNEMRKPHSLADYPPERVAAMTLGELTDTIARTSEDTALMMAQMTARKPVGVVPESEWAEYRDWHRRATHAMAAKAAVRTRLKAELTRRHQAGAILAADKRSPRAILGDIVRELNQCDMMPRLAELVAEAMERIPGILGETWEGKQ